MGEVVIIGSGFSGLATACCLADAGFQVKLLEKNNSAGGRARRFKESGFTFDMGPSWYWMPDVFEQFFNKFGRNVKDFYHLKRLDPSYKMFFKDMSSMDIPANYQELRALFNSVEPGADEQLDKFLGQAQIKYEVGMNDLIFKPGISPIEFINRQTINGALRLDLFQSFHKHVRKYFKSPVLTQILTFPILFLGASAKDTPALYSLMNYADIKLGTWYPQGGMYEVVSGLVELAKSLGVTFHFEEEVQAIELDSSTAKGVKTQNRKWSADLVVASADYHHIETTCLPKHLQSYTSGYWERRTMAPSSLIYFLGCSKKIEGIQHHNLFFDEDLDQHTEEIYHNQKWPSKPLFYVSATSISDPSVCPENHENLFILIPVAPDLQDTPEVREKYFELVVSRMERLTGQEIKSSIVYKRSYAHKEFIADYHAFKGNAYGLANTIRQTAFLKPKIKSKKVKNLYYTGQLTVPGPGVPPSLISGQIVANQIIKDFRHEAAV